MAVGLVDVRDLLKGTLGDVESIAKSPVVMRELLNDLRTAERILAARLRDQMTKYGSLDARFSGAQALALQQQLYQTVDYVQDRLRGRTMQQAETAITAGLDRTVTLMEGLERRFVGVATPLRLRQANELRGAQHQARGLWARDFPTSVDRYGTKMLGEVEEIIRAGFVAGSSMDDVIAALTGHGGPTGKVSMSAKVTPAGVLRVVESDIPEGLFVRHKYWAERIVRTEMLRAYNGARQVGLEHIHDNNFPGMKRKILAVLDKRTAPDSLSVHGQIRGIKDPFADGAGRVYMYPPARPNDRETVIPWRTEWEESADNLSEWEKACIGEGDADLEKKLEAALTGLKPTKTPSGKVKAPTGTAPIDKPKKPTYHEKIETELRAGLGYGKFTGATFTGEQVGYVAPEHGFWRAHSLMRGRSDLLATFNTEDEAKAGLMQHWNERLAKSARSIDKWSEKDYKAAVGAKDGTKMRRLVRGLLYENGVLPLDAVLSDAADTMLITANSRMPDARAYHHWDGRVELRRDVFEEATRKSGLRPRHGEPDQWILDSERQTYAKHLRTMIHEELHGSTSFYGSGFYAGYGATIEEVTVEMAARRIAAKATGIGADLYGGSYQPQIEAVVKIVQEEVAVVLGQHRGTKDREAISEAGIAMRSRKVTVRAAGAPDGIVDQFMSTLKVPTKAKARIRARILAEVKAPR